MLITKASMKAEKNLLDEYHYPRARDAFADLLNQMVAAKILDILLVPAYIGWSSKEGSGIFDPIESVNNLQHKFYSINGDLSVDIQSLEKQIASCGNARFGVLVVNYFGFLEPRIKEVASIVRLNSGWLFEDNAHAYFSYLNNFDYSADASFFSLHKMFPIPSGGMLHISNEQLAHLHFSGQEKASYNYLKYDVRLISEKRRNNYRLLESLLKSNYTTYCMPLKRGVDCITVPQTFPVLILTGNRDVIYQKMNDCGYGVVSLYHHLITPLTVGKHDVSHKISKQILNLPVHQDVNPELYLGMIRCLRDSCEVSASQMG